MKDHSARAFLKYAWRQVNLNRFGFFGCTTGTGGMGKSRTSLLLAWLEDETLNESTLQERWCRRPTDYLKRVNECSKSWFALDDAGISSSLSSKNWMELSNILVEDTSQLQRIKYNGSFIISQNIGFIDNRIRALLEWFFEVKRYEMYSPVIWVHKISVNQQRQKIFFPHPIFKIDNRTIKLSRICIRASLPKRIEDGFEEMDIAFKEMMLKKHYKVVMGIEEESSQLDIWEMIEKVSNEKGKYVNNHGRLDKSLLQLHFNISRDKADQIVNFINNQSQK